MQNVSPIQDNQPRSETSSQLGKRGEEIALLHLTGLGARIVCANFKAPVGRNIRGALITGEIDLIVYDRDVLCFIEVKTRRSDEFLSPVANVDLRKQRQITRTAKMYRRIFHLQDIKFRFDVVSVVLPDGERPQVEYFKNFWTEEKFRKRSWNREEF